MIKTDNTILDLFWKAEFAKVGVSYVDSIDDAREDKRREWKQYGG
jgi:hypothetical protein